jgi:ABC-type phosphate transport system substrate-binding protein
VAADGTPASRVPVPVLALVVNDRWREAEAIPIPVLRQLWLGRRTRWAGQRVLCLDLPSGSRVRATFVDVVVGRTERSLERYWLRQALSGGPPPPRELASEQDVLRRVAQRTGVIGYVTWSAVRPAPPDGVRVLAVEVDGRRLRPGDDGYPVRAAPGAGHSTPEPPAS